MAKVIATSKGYFGGMIREIGDRFDVPDDIWNDKDRRPSWAQPAKFGGKGDHDGDGRVGGSVPAGGRAEFASTDGVVVPEGWRDLPAKDRRTLADNINAVVGNEAGKVANAKEADDVIETYLGLVSHSAPFGDAPAPQTAKGNGLQEALGGTAPDWVDPNAGGDDTPVMAEE